MRAMPMAIPIPISFQSDPLISISLEQAIEMSERLIKAAWEDFATEISVRLGQLVPSVANRLAKSRTVSLRISILHRN